jgi:hypothetical protein
MLIFDNLEFLDNVIEIDRRFSSLLFLDSFIKREFFEMIFLKSLIFALFLPILAAYASENENPILDVMKTEGKLTIQIDTEQLSEKINKEKDRIINQVENKAPKIEKEANRIGKQIENFGKKLNKWKF